MQGLFVTHILYITACGASQRLSQTSKSNTNTNTAKFDFESHTFCDREISNKTFIAPKIIIACLKFVEAYIDTHPYDEQIAVHDPTNEEQMLANPDIVEYWTKTYTSDDLYNELEKYYNVGRIKPSTVARIIAMWHAQFTQIFYHTNSKKEYISINTRSTENTIWNDGAKSKQCLKGMYLQIVLHIFTVPESQRIAAFSVIFKHRIIPNSFNDIENVWIEYRKEHIQLYEKSDTITYLAIRYSEKPDCMCEAYDFNTMRGPKQLENAINKIHDLMGPDKSWWPDYFEIDQKNELKIDFFMGQVTNMKGYPGTSAIAFVTYFIRLLLPKLGDLILVEDADLMNSLFTSLTESGLNYCIIGGILRSLETVTFIKQHWATDDSVIHRMLEEPIGYTKVEPRLIDVIKALTNRRHTWQTQMAQSYWEQQQWAQETPVWAV